jgi:hypothetical protein
VGAAEEVVSDLLEAMMLDVSIRIALTLSAERVLSRASPESGCFRAAQYFPFVRNRQRRQDTVALSVKQIADTVPTIVEVSRAFDGKRCKYLGVQGRDVRGKPRG